MLVFGCQAFLKELCSFTLNILAYSIFIRVHGCLNRNKVSHRLFALVWITWVYRLYLKFTECSPIQNPFYWAQIKPLWCISKFCDELTKLHWRSITAEKSPNLCIVSRTLNIFLFIIFFFLFRMEKWSQSTTSLQLNDWGFMAKFVRDQVAGGLAS